MSATRFIMPCKVDRNTIIAQLFILGHHHDIIEEGVDVIAQMGQCLQRAGEIALCKCRIDLRFQYAHGRV